MIPKKPFIISLGGGKNQIPFIEACIRKGYKTIVVDKNPKAPAFALADIKIIESITEYRKIYLLLLKAIFNSTIAGIGCRSYGKANSTLAYLSEKLNLVGSPLFSVKKFYHKYHLKSLLERYKIPIPEQVLFIPNQKFFISQTYFPCIAKPVSGESKRGIFFFENKTDLEKFLQNIQEEYTIEKFIEGKEITVLGFVQNRKFHLVSISDKITTNFPPFLELAHILPSSFPDLVGEIRFTCQQIVNITGLINSPLVAEFKVDSKKNIYLIEVIPEIGGEFLAEMLVKKHYEYDYFEDYVRLITGQKLILHKFKKKNLETWIRYLSPLQGRYMLNSIIETPISEKLDIFYDRTFLMPNTIIDSNNGNSSRIRVIGFQKRPNPFRENFIPNKTFHLEAILEPYHENME